MSFTFDQFRPTQAIIHIENLQHNLKELSRMLSVDQFFCPMVKANAYGHGDIEVAKALEALGVKTMGVGLIEEGVLLRGMGIEAELIFFGVMDRVGARACLDHRLIPVLSSWQQIFDLKFAMRAEEIVEVHLKFDTGMHRLGFEPEETEKLIDYFHEHPEFRLVGLLTHLHSGEDAADIQGESFQQLRLFEGLAKRFSEWRPRLHSLNSAGMINLARLAYSGIQSVSGVSLKQGVRPGLALYGYSPVDSSELKLDLRPVMSLRSQVVRVRRLEAGQGVSYSHKWKSVRPSWIGVVPMGYADGYHRLLSNSSVVLIDGQRVPLVGNVCMDYFMVDLTDLVRGSGAEAFLWKEVTLFGYDSDKNFLSVRDLAKNAQTIPWEILTSVGERVPRVIQNREKK